MAFRRVSAYIAVLMLTFSLGCGKKSDNAETPATTANPANGAAPETNAKTGEPRLKTRSSEGTAAALPAGKIITVRLGETLSSKTSQAGQGFSATVAEPVTENGTVVVPQGATAHGTVVDARPLGRFKGGALLRVRLTSITVNGKDTPVDTAAVGRSMKGKGKRTLTMAGGGAGLGALIGGLAGGGKGAAIGALAGGGAGTAGAAFTGNKDVVIPAETALSFKLLRAVDLTK